MDSLWLEHLAGGRVTYYDAAGVPTRSIEAGNEGPAVVMLHGLWGHAETYIANVLPISRCGFRTFSIDMLGHGYTGRPDGCKYDIKDYLDHLMAFVDAIGATTVSLVGESLGGWVALKAALAYPERITSIVNAVGGGLRPIPPTEQEIAGWSQVGDLAQSIVVEPTWEAWRKRMDWLVLDPSSMPDEIVKVRQQINADPQVREVSGRMARAIKEKQLQQQEILTPDELSALTVPVLYLWTDHNPTTPASVAELARKLTPNSEFALLEHCAHWPQLERPDDFNTITVEFLRRHS
jgi:2-hydroxy-6-oxonona-2,4-dienedioate hydrolase/2-hydroxy-6-oxo-6-(2'-carboxyphenyl)-hexa-2,4-dienoate hydrolase